MAEVGKPKMEVPVYEPPAEIAAEIEAYGADKLKEALMDANKLEREENVAKVKAEIAEVFIEKYPDNAKDVAYITQKLVKRSFAVLFPLIRSVLTDVSWMKYVLLPAK